MLQKLYFLALLSVPLVCFLFFSKPQKLTILNGQLKLHILKKSFFEVLVPHHPFHSLIFWIKVQWFTLLKSYVDTIALDYFALR